MIKTLDMQFIRYMNLFGKISRVTPKYCFPYNNMLIFVVPKNEVQIAIGPDNRNLEKLSQILRKRIRVVAEPKSQEINEIQSFVKIIVSPVEFKNIELKENSIFITADREGKARLIGRQRIRQRELETILGQYFGIKNIGFI